MNVVDGVDAVIEGHERWIGQRLRWTQNFSFRSGRGAESYSVEFFGRLRGYRAVRTRGRFRTRVAEESGVCGAHVNSHAGTVGSSALEGGDEGDEGDDHNDGGAQDR